MYHRLRPRRSGHDGERVRVEGQGREQHERRGCTQQVLDVQQLQDFLIRPALLHARVVPPALQEAGRPLRAAQEDNIRVEQRQGVARPTMGVASYHNLHPRVLPVLREKPPQNVVAELVEVREDGVGADPEDPLLGDVALGNPMLLDEHLGVLDVHPADGKVPGVHHEGVPEPTGPIGIDSQGISRIGVHMRRGVRDNQNTALVVVGIAVRISHGRYGLVGTPHLRPCRCRRTTHSIHDASGCGRRQCRRLRRRTGCSDLRRTPRALGPGSAAGRRRGRDRGPGRRRRGGP
mmetsp:Transcript_95236/g.308405  ORF Transcript_95236/g.308405 Transcript_95236/m.308405 type:complete len:291 (-) Transcript_95236:2009-2881(-)